MKPEPDLTHLVMALDAVTDADADPIYQQLVAHKEDALPSMLACFGRLRKWHARRSVIYRAVKFARTSDLARQLGHLGLKDKSKVVRWRACGLAAYSLDRGFLPVLRPLLDHADPETVADARAAINAIEAQNHHFFIDRTQSGTIRWNVNGADVDGR